GPCKSVPHAKDEVLCVFFIDDFFCFFFRPSLLQIQLATALEVIHIFVEDAAAQSALVVFFLHLREHNSSLCKGNDESDALGKNVQKMVP
ncbi:hypothetical protein TGMAS_413390, partial [Toxoplasma gondii MAS]